MRTESCSSDSRSDHRLSGFGRLRRHRDEVTGLDEATILSAANLNLADSVLNAPAAAFGGEEFYPYFVDRCAVLAVRLAKNHALPDGNKRVCWVSLRLFIEINGWEWTRRPSIADI